MKASSHALPIAAFLAALTLAGPAQASDDGADETRVVVTDTRGRPPFKRVRVNSDAEFARFETDAAAPSAARAVDFRGRPPFTRQPAEAAETADAEFARFEETTERPRRWGPPGKATSRR